MLDGTVSRSYYILMPHYLCKLLIKVNVKVKERIAVNGIPSHSYRVSLAVWDHTVLPATQHK